MKHYTIRAFATELKISPSRVMQLIANGAIKRKKTKIEVLRIPESQLKRAKTLVHKKT